ncbi:MAG: glycosyl transferase family 2 [Candidatus Paceibacter sp.]|jgi:dolichol-phosphate mannosyltransferase|nr:glycosyl transferase family 2 [Candidatus Paceibacter sp.]
MSFPFSLSVVVTVYSETFSVSETIGRLLKQDRGYIKEIIIAISPRSSKESFDVCNGLAQKYPNLVKVHVQKNNPGAGWAYREGMELATGDYVTLMSGDLETEPEAVDRMVKKIEETGCDCVMTSRWLPGGGFVNYDKKKRALNWLFQKMFRILYWTKLTDITYGFKTLKKSVIDSITWEGTLHEIFIETTVKPLKKGYTIEEIPTVWIGRREGTSKNTFMKNFRYIRVALKTLVS